MRPLPKFYLILAMCITLAGMAGAENPKTVEGKDIEYAVINDIWRNPSEPAGDTKIIYYDIDVFDEAGTMSVYEKLHYRIKGSGTWLYYSTSPSHEINGDNLEVTSMEITLPQGTYDLKLEVYETGFSTPDDVEFEDEALKNILFTLGDGIVKRRAVVIGISDYIGTVNDLNYSDDDARDFANALQWDSEWVESGGYIELLIDSEATYQNIKEKIQKMVADSDEDDICVLFYSGHGTAAPDSGIMDESDGLDEYICPHDFVNISDDELSDWIAQHTTDTFGVFIDACFSGGQIKAPQPNLRSKTVNRSGYVPAPGSGFLEETLYKAKDLNTIPNLVVATASDSFELSYESEIWSNGLFTEYLLESMYSPMSDTDGSGMLAVEESYDYLYPLVVEELFGFQNPQLYDGNGFFQPCEYMEAAVDLIGVLIPNGGQNWRGAQSFVITWRPEFYPSENVKIYLYEGTTYLSTLSGGTLNDGSWIWEVSDKIPQGSDYKICVLSEDKSVRDYSDEPFTINSAYGTISPNGGETWTAGHTYNITWDDFVFPTSAVKIYLYKNGEFHSAISAETENDGSMAWNIPMSTPGGTDYKVCVMDFDRAVRDYSDDNFTILPGTAAKNWEAYR